MTRPATMPHATSHLETRRRSGAASGPVQVQAPARPSDAGSLRLVRMMHYLEWLAGRLNRAGIPVMVLKGAALHLTLYRRPRDRAMVDLDILVRPDDVDRALGVLEDAGCLRRFTPIREDFFPRYHSEVEYTAGSLDPVEIDVHVRPFRVLRYTRLVPDDGLFERARRVRVGDAEVLVPSREDMLIHLAVHCAIHGNTEAKWLVDLKRWVETHRRDLDWPALLGTVRRWRLGLPVRRAFAAAELRLGRFVPGEVRRALHGMPAGWRDRLALWHAPRDRANLTRSFLVNLVTTPGLAFLAGYLHTILVPERQYMDQWCIRHDTQRRWARLRRCAQPVLDRLRRSPAIEVGPSRVHGQGLIAQRDFAPGTVVARYRGRPIDRDGTYVSLHREADGRAARHEITGPLRHLNHCCRPNAELRRFRLVALRPIRRGQEITVCYGDDVCDCTRRAVDMGERDAP